MKQIVCISQHYWDDRWFRKQHFMSRFVKKGFKIAYIEPSVSLVRKPAVSKKDFAIHDWQNVMIEKRAENLYLIKPPKSLPFWNYPIFTAVAFKYLSKKIQRELTRLNFKEFLLWIYNPQWVHGLSNFNSKKVIFDIADNLPEFYHNNYLKYKNIQYCCNELAKKSDLIFTTASALSEQYKPLAKNNNIYNIPNGFDVKRFENKSSCLIPKELNDFPRPIVGFIGTIFPFLDFNLINFLIDRNPDKTFVFVGGCDGKVNEEWSKICNKPNVSWLGKKMPEDIPAYIQSFDICLNPFQVNSISEAVNPLKVYEYLASNKRVVSVRMKSLENELIAKYIDFSDSYDDFNRKLNFILANDLKQSIDQKLLQSYSWDTIFDKVFTLVEKL